ncbi:MAG: hypothetical protein V7603_4613 [Micromonosporaceae bacterium]
MNDVRLIPRGLLFGLPARMNPSLSPSGTHLAFLAPRAKAMNVWVGSLDERDFQPLTDLRGQPINEYLWARDGRHLLYLTDRDGDENQHLIAVDLSNGDTRDLTPFDGVRVHIVGMAWRAPHHVLVEMNLDSPTRNDLYRLDLRDGRRERVATEPGLTGWVTDPDLVVRAAEAPDDDGGFTVVVRDDERSAWRPLLTLGYEDAVGSQLLGFTSDGKDLLLLSPLDAEAARLLRLSTATGAVEVLYGEPTYDVTGATLHPTTGEVDLVVVDRERVALVPLAEDTAADLATIRAHSRGDVSPLGRDLGHRMWLLQDVVDDGPTLFRLYHRDSGVLETLFSHQPELTRYRCARVRPFSFTARDGLTITGYLTFPPGEARHLPTVLNVHGGPWDRNRWGFRGESQWLANRGYLCVEVNFRGSAGYGRSFTLAGDREWGGRMQDDLVDALGWVVAQGHTDPDRVAICGSSYGGYAALVGAAFTPDLFRCAIAAAAPVNLKTFIESVPEYWPHVRDQLRRRVGDPDADADLLWARSPLSRVADIRIPLLLAYGRNDPRVPVTEAEQLVRALRDNDIPHQYLLFEDEGHGFGRLANGLAFQAVQEEFLASHLGGRVEPGDGS